MCGIIGCTGGTDLVPTLLNGLAKLEYRGYDSAGVAVSNSRIHVLKREGELDELVGAVRDEENIGGTVGIGHTRWSTHGKPSDENAHPHTDCENRVAVVHNGIIENNHSLRDELHGLGHEFESETDTEVIPHLIGNYLDRGATPKEAFRLAVEKLEGSYAIAAVFESCDEVMATRKDSSLVLGVGDGVYIASDVTALVERTDTVVHLHDGEFAYLSEDGYTIVDRSGTPQSKTGTTIEWDAEAMAKGNHDHYMIKEIYEQSSALRECLRDRFAGEFVSLDAAADYRSVDSVHLVACGTSYHAALYGANLLCERGIPAQTFLASEYAMSPPPIRDGTLVVGVTQSGETADTLSALRVANERDAHTLALTNVIGSTATRECDDALYIRSGPEISVAATKTFASQLVTLVLFVLQLSADESSRDETRRLVSALTELPERVQTVLDTSNAEAVARRFVDSSGNFFIGRGMQYPVALEGALKMKEITYEHAEGFAAGELKHGPLALVTEETPVFVSIVGDDEIARKTVSNAEEVKARDAPLVVVTDGQSSVEEVADEILSVPTTNPTLAPILVNVQYQLLAYHTARLLGRDIDKPRNLAKSVTVE
ncbi:glutamine--fructose-6-phosphate aminotransferase [Haladaptatus sp. R4]|uniref:glutamine--fructose-6-phosphate transaminase (isomerizing) n=1 Tax=Haladaptatus sp. R4 TaxID=1679489 RepID=UPI0007B4CF58|nr:glutamine--fructose-6-phosphate transaminase (isomerizing) [Haladaptatus sp. R4]KZN26237.1 glutamine--fructose-6-phosphate aminotransferase [Haladaptatus sp. R4]